MIDEEVKRIVMHGYETAKQILTDHAEALTKIAEALLERESIEASDIELILKGQPLPDLAHRPAEAETDETETPAETPTDREPESPTVLPKPGEQPA